MLSFPVNIQCTMGLLSRDSKDRMYTAVSRGSITMMKIWLIAVMVVLTLIAVDIV